MTVIGFVLFILCWQDGYVHSPSVTTVEFNSEARCDAALQALIKERNDWEVTDKRLRAFCVPK
jgi:hypothetical protein